MHGAVSGERYCTGNSLPPDAELPPAGALVEAGKIEVPIDPQRKLATEVFVYVFANLGH